MKKILWITECWAYDTDKEITPYLMQNSDFSITWYVVGKHGFIPDNNDCSFIEHPYSGWKFKSLRFYIKMFDCIDIKNYDLIYSTFHGGPFYYPAMYLKKNKSTLVIHGAHNVIPYPVWPLLLRLAVKLEFAINNHFQMFSKHTAKWFKEHYPNKSFFYAPMVVKDYGKVRTNNYSVNKNKINLLFFGNVVANKRLDLLIEAVKGLPKDIQDKIHLNICGNCKKDKEAFVQQIGECKAISTYFRRIPDEEIPELFTKHQFLMLPYEDVAQSGPHMIAYAYNLPVIASDIDGFAERVEDNKNGFLFHKNDVGNLINVITKAVMMTEQDRNSMRKQLQKYVTENYSLIAVSQRYIKYFNEIIKR